MTVEDLTPVDLRRAREAIEYYYENGWTDGLPVVPPIQEFVDEFLATTRRDPNEVILEQAHLDRKCTIRQAAINAVMAGCKPEYFPVVLAALDAFRQIDGGGGMMQSTTGQALVLIVNGPIRNKLEVNCTGNIFGSGDRANATIGRAVRLIVLNVMEIRPHDIDQSTQGTPAKYSCCFGENEEESPWAPLHVDLGYAPEASTVTAQLIRSDLHVEHRSTQTPEHILNSLADSLSYAGAIYEAPPYNRSNGGIIVLGPEHAAIIAAGGWTKDCVRDYLYEHYGKTMRDLRSYGKVIGLENEPDDAFIISAKSAEALLIVVAGASNAGVSTVGMSFANRRGIGIVEET
ncbi:MAG TPA: hypothetical protein VFY10_16435 [Dehalococcoidia bacterium]|nr:hypothetical protein [Dehalococcoidia bacterium]